MTNDRDNLKAMALQRKLPDAIKLGSADSEWIQNALLLCSRMGDDTLLRLSEREKSKKMVTDSSGGNVKLDDLVWAVDYKQRILTESLGIDPMFENHSHIRFAELVPKKILPYHLDSPWTYRFIIMLYGSHVFETELGNRYEMSVGDIYYVNGCYKHRIINDGDVTRIAVLGNFEINDTTTELLRTRS